METWLHQGHGDRKHMGGQGWQAALGPALGIVGSLYRVGRISFGEVKSVLWAGP